nr:hypothetical protein [Cellulomonas endophytica]
MRAGVLTAVVGPAEALLVEALGSADRLDVVRRCADLAELLAAAEAGLGSVVLVSAGLPHLDHAAVDALRRTAGVVVGVAGADRPDEGDRLRAWTVDAVVAAPEDVPAAAEVVDAVLAALDAAARPGLAPVARAVDRPGPHPVPVGTAVPRPPGRLVAVWGPTGAPGRTTVAVNLAAEVAALGVRTLLVDADTYGGAVATAVGMLDEAPGLAAAVRAAGAGALDLPTLARHAPVLGPDLRVLAGLARADRWPELPPAALDVVWARARELAALTVVDTGFCLEEDELLTYDTRAPQRNGATLSALDAADVVVVVGSADPVGLQRLVRGLDELARRPAAAARRLVVVNRVRPGVAGPDPGRAVRDVLARHAGVVDPVLVPEDRDGVDAAVLEGRLLREVVPGSPARRALVGLAGALLPEEPSSTPGPTRRQRLGRRHRATVAS